MIELLMMDKSQLVCISETMSAFEALTLLEAQHLRCAPVLDATQTLYRGNVYRYHIYQHHFHHPEADLTQVPVTYFLKNTTRVAYLNQSLYQLIFAMTDLPYVAILDKKRAFKGIVKHGTLLNFLSQAWTMEKAGHVLHVATLGSTGELARISKIINKYSDISASMTLEATQYDNRAGILFVLNQQLDSLQLQRLLQELDKKQYKTTHYKLH